MKNILIIISTGLMLAGCSITTDTLSSTPSTIENSSEELVNFNPPTSGPMVVAVYQFQDKTGQRKPSDRLANISTAVTQGAEQYVIKTLKDVGNGTWFKVVERVGLENLARERQIVRQTRESVNDETPLAPMMFAGVIVEGAIVGYDSNVTTGGAGARYLGIGPFTEYREDIITLTMRIVSVQTGEILTSVSTSKKVISSSGDLGVFKFIEAGTEALELEFGTSINEPINYAVKLAVESAVLETLKQGASKGYWGISEKKE